MSTSRTTNVSVSSTIASNGELALSDGSTVAHLRWYNSGNSDGARLWDTGLYSNGSRTNTTYSSGLKVTNSITQPTFSSTLNNTFNLKLMIIKY